MVFSTLINVFWLNINYGIYTYMILTLLHIFSLIQHMPIEVSGHPYHLVIPLN
ncbi:hypothetical protein VCHA38O209_320014 [Vibrio chagasii]|nr:hypothetical protein VCHA36P166_180063 [Vibrio chagasii]CAH7064325.1 hypothetical protein VCHA40P238_10316 [Vibrio chagasii]CAH7216574.1 hypothetical protein VCHA37P193_390023 [Vibrio chagasii]CAH7440137.1 hypothetical protein VCHA37P192_40236 [Vibrio chagasii]CAH7441599.1 hypothetical protein VCHA38O209_320014 [Vibrio chagasii]